MTEEEIRKLADTLAHQFRPAVTGLEEGTIRVLLTNVSEIQITIGPRTVTLNRSLDVVSAETMIEEE